jgi:tripartite-type tricarboxylate transporter receptor subunit TctC
MHGRRGFLKAALGFALVGAARAQAKFPSKPIRFIVPFAAGGGGDIVARLLAHRLSERLGSPVMVENKTGAGGNIGAEFVLRSPPDGYTLLNMSSTYPIQAAVSRLPFDPIADMQPIVMVSRDPVMIMVRSDSPIRGVPELLEHAGRNPGKLTYGSAGVGSIAHLGTEEMAHLMGIRLTHIPYKGTSQAFNDLIGGSLDLMLSSAAFGAPYVKSGRVRALVVVGERRHERFPEVATFKEAGYAAFQVHDWKALAGPRGMPPEVVAFLNAELNAVLKDRAVADKLEAEGSAPIGGTPAEMMATIIADIERWKSVAMRAKIQME